MNDSEMRRDRLYFSERLLYENDPEARSALERLARHRERVASYEFALREIAGGCEDGAAIARVILKKYGLDG